MFAYLNGASVYDLTFDSSNAYSYTPNSNVVAGMLAGQTQNTTVVNVSNYANMTVSNAGVTNGGAHIYFGGLIGNSVGGYARIYKSLYQGNLATTAGADTVTSFSDNSVYVSGIIGSNIGATETTVDAVYVKFTYTAKHGGLCTGAVLGGGGSGSGIFKFSNILATIECNASGTTTSPDIRGITGWMSASGGITANSASFLKNIYFSSETYTSNLVSLNGITPEATYRYPSTITAQATNPVATVAAVGAAAAANSTLKTYFNINSSAATATSKLNVAGNINYDLGGGSWTTGAATTYNPGTAKTIAQLGTKPTKSGFTFSKWSFDPHGTTTISSNQIPAATSGNITIYAIWTLNAFSGSVSNTTVVYESDATLSSAGVTIPGSVGTGVGQVKVTYQWKNASGTAISGQTGSTYKLTKPGVTAGTNYQVTITSTPNDGRTAAKSSTYTVKLVVQRKGITVPKANTGLIYNGSSQTGVTLPSGAKYTLSGNTGTNAGPYTAKAVLSDKNNYCWGSNNGTDTADKSISWSIGKASVAIPSITTANGTFIYSGSPQQPTITYGANSTSLVNYTAAPQTNVGVYTAYVKLNNTTNYKWASTPSGVAESADYPLTWRINKADVNVTAPSISNSNVYVGQLLSEIAFANGGAATATNSTTTSNTVTGTFAWKDATQKAPAVSDGASRVAVFTPSDTANYNTKEVNVVFGSKLVQLYVNVYEAQVQFVTSDGTNETLSFTLPAVGSNITRTQRVNRAVVQYPVDYKSNFTIASIGSDTAKNWQNPTGYSMHYYKAQNSDLSGSVEYDTATINNITANQRVYIDYVPSTNGSYTVFHIYETTSNGVATKEGIQEALNSSNVAKALEAIGVTRQIVENATVGSKVNGANANTAGFTFARELTDGTQGTHTSDYQSKFVRGDNETVLYMYYKRNTYTVTWDLRGGSVNIDGTIRKDTVRQTNVLFGGAVNKIPDPTRDQYTFDNWYADSDYNEVAIIAETMPARNVTYYAFWRGDEYYLHYDNTGTGIDSRYQQLLGEGPDKLGKIEAADNPEMFSTDGLLKSTIMLKNPTLVGYTFVGWYIQGTDTRVTSIAYGQNYITQDKGTLNLVARWSPQTYTITLDPNGGRKTSPSTIRVTNMTNYTSSTSLRDGTLPTPVYAGYNFVEWYYVNKIDDSEIAVNDSTYFNYLTNNLTLVARWEKKSWDVTYSELLNDGTTTAAPEWAISEPTFTVNGSAVDSEGQPWVADSLAGNIAIGDVLTVTVNPEDGYEVAEIRIANTRVSSGNRYTVKSSYTNDTLNIVVTLRYKTYRINYEWFGGTYGLAPATLTQSFTLKDENVVFPNQNNVSRLGYTFANWFVNATSEDGGIGMELGYDNEIVIERMEDWFIATGVEVGDITLYAEWEAANVDVILHQNVQNEQTTVFMEGQTRTGDVIEIQGVDAQFIPTNRELAGWALSPDGNIAYPVEYDKDYNVLPLKYTVQAKLNTSNNKLENHLYAVWRLTNVQFLVFSTPNNNAQYSPSSTWDGVTMTARPRYTYVADPTISIDFTWYKADLAWDKWTEADLPEDQDSAAYAEIYAKLGTYKVPADATPVRTYTLSSVLDDNQYDSYTIKNVADSGIYVCVMTAHGERLTSNNTQATSVATGVGQYEVTVRKANFDGITLKDVLDAKYNAEIHTLSVSVANGATVNENSNIVLPDGSVLAVVYTYVTTGTDETTANGVILAGSYTVRAEFAWIKDNGNYNLPEELVASLDIAKQVINNVSYKLEQQNEDGTWSEVQASPNSLDGELSFTPVSYSNAAYRVVATSNDIFEADRNGNVVIAIFTEGDLSDPNGGADLDYATYVGDYRAYCDELTGARANSYLLNSSAIKPVVYSIAKRVHELEIVFNDKTVSYDRANPTTAQEIEISSIADKSTGLAVNVPMIKNADGTVTIELSAGRRVTISYSSVYTPYNSAFSGSKTNNGGANAGEYVITATFKDTEINEANFEAIESVSATLTVKQAAYVLSDDELNKDATDTDVNDIIIGFVNNQSFEYRTNTAIKYFAQMNLDGNFTVEYRGTRTFESAGGSGTETAKLDDADIRAGVRLPGRYSITAKIVYSSENYKNNYLGIAEQTVELEISRGEVESITIEYTQGTTDLYTYFDTFDIEDNYYSNKLNVIVTYKSDVVGQPGQTEEVDVAICNFYGEDGSLFERFDRATANTVGTNSGKYKIDVECYGKKSSASGNYIEVEVQQAEFNSDSVAFVSDNNLAYVSQSGGKDVYSLNFTYDGTYHNPVVSGADTAYNFVGVDDETGVNHGITVKYMLAKGSDAATEMGKDGGGNYVGIRDQGQYTITITFEHTDGNYKTITKTFEVKANVAKRQLTADDIIWQYNDGSNWVTVTGENKKYIGVDYEVRAVYRDLTSTAANPTYITVGGIKVNNKQVNGTSVTITATSPAASVLLKDAAVYTIQISALGTEAANDNYTVPTSNLITVEFTIDPKEITLDWAIDGDSLVYNADNQMSKVSVSYKGVDGTDGAENVVNIAAGDVKVTDARFTAQDSVAADVIKHAGTYVLTATVTDSNYVAAVDTYTVTVAPKTVTEATFTYATDSDPVEINKDGTTTAIYKGGEFDITVTFDGIENDTFVAPFTAKSLDGHIFRNANEYIVVAGIDGSGNYNITAQRSFTIDKADVTINWQEETNKFVYTGSEQRVQIVANGVGDESGITVVELTGHNAVNANVGTFDDSFNLAQAAIAQAYADNYKFAAGTETSFKWRIEPKAITVEWSNNPMTYTGYVIPFTATALDLDNVALTLETKITIKDAPDAALIGTVVNEMVNAYTYTVEVTAIVGNTNYTITGGTGITNDYTVNKATPVITDVSYNEFGLVNVAYRNSTSPLKLRNDKIVYNSNGVKGTIKFVQEYTITTTGYGIARCVFTPDDTVNYNVVDTGIEIQIEKKDDKAERIGLETSIKYFMVNSDVSKSSFRFYIEYTSFYTEKDVNGVDQVYGYRSRITDVADVSFVINGINGTYRIKDEDIDTGITINVDYGMLSGNLWLPVTKSAPRSISIADVDSWTSAKYYVGSTFDYSTMKFNVVFEDGGDGVLNASQVTVSKTLLPETAGAFDITFTYGTVSVKLTITVSDKETITLAFADKTYKYTGSAITPIVQQIDEIGNVVPLPDDVTVTFKNVDGTALGAIINEDDYRVMVEVTGPEYKYQLTNGIIATATATIKVRAFDLMIDESQVVYPSTIIEGVMTYDYNGEERAYKLANVVIKDSDGKVYDYEDGAIEYVIKRANGEIVTKLVEAGTYNIHVEVKVYNSSTEEDATVEHDYTVVVNKVDNVIHSLTMGSWISGGEAQSPVIVATFGTDKVVYEYFTAEGTSLGKVKPTGVGNYTVTATIPGTDSYTEQSKTVSFSINNDKYAPSHDKDGNSLKDEQGNDKIVISTDNGIDPSYVLVVETLKDAELSGIEVKNKIVLGGYNLELVDNKGNHIDTTNEEYTVKLLLAPDQRNGKKYAVYSIDENGYKSVVDTARREGDYMVFTTNDFAQDYVITCRDEEAMKRIGLIVGVSVGAVIAVGVITAVIVVFVKKKKEND